jgi:hypothetical protein
MSLFTKTVDSILADVKKKIDQLVRLADEQRAIAQTKSAEAQSALYDAEVARLEAERALRISARIEELVA